MLIRNDDKRAVDKNRPYNNSLGNYRSSSLIRKWGCGLSSPSWRLSVAWSSFIIIDRFGRRWQAGLQLCQGAVINTPLKKYHIFNRMPKIDPLPLIEFRLARSTQINVFFATTKLQQEPDLLLADAMRQCFFPDQTLWQLISQPAGGRGQ